MELPPSNPEKTHGPHGTSSTLNRYNASYAIAPQCDLNSFLIALADNHGDLHIEKIDTDNEAIIPAVEVKQPLLECPRCKKDAANTSELLKHVLTHYSEWHNDMFEKCGVINNDADLLMKEAMDIQTKNSFIRLKIEDSDYIIVCRMESPLYLFLALRNLKVYLDDPPEVKTKGFPRMFKIPLARPDRAYLLIFSWAQIDRVQKRIRKNMKAKRDKHEMKFYEEKYQKFVLEDEDVVFKRMKTDEELECLSKALNLPRDFSQQQLREMIKKFDTKTSVVDNGPPLAYDAVVDRQGNVISKEQRKLITTLTGEFMQAGDRKRKCTRNKRYDVDL